MAKTKTKGRSPLHGEQAVIEGTGPEKNERVHDHAIRYAKERDKRIAANVKEKDAHASLLAVMKEEQLERYVYGDLSVFVDKSEKCKVSTEGKPADADEE